MAYKYIQGRFTPTNPKKYRGDAGNIIFRSSWELILFRWLDSTEGVLAWQSEETIIMYTSPVDGKKHRYFLDVTAHVKVPKSEECPHGVKKFFIEVKPKDQVKKPHRTPKMSEATYAENVRTWLVNQAKWESAKQYAKANGGEFIVLTEDHILPSQTSLKRYKQPKKDK